MLATPAPHDRYTAGQALAAKERRSMAPSVTLAQVYARIRQRLSADASESYVARLAAQGQDAVLKKIGEECCEVLLAAKNGERAPAVHELADLWFHLLVWMAQAGIAPEDVEAELGRRYHQGQTPG
jgi:phosphoribosyl-ATP pyrophosphohydrolase